MQCSRRARVMCPCPCRAHAVVPWCGAPRFAVPCPRRARAVAPRHVCRAVVPWFGAPWCCGVSCRVRAAPWLCRARAVPPWCAVPVPCPYRAHAVVCRARAMVLWCGAPWCRGVLCCAARLWICAVCLAVCRAVCLVVRRAVLRRVAQCHVYQMNGLSQRDRHQDRTPVQ